MRARMLLGFLVLAGLAFTPLAPQPPDEESTGKVTVGYQPIVTPLDTTPPDEEAGGIVLSGFGTNNGFTTAEQFADDTAEFEEVETIATGLGPCFNAASCVSCHAVPVTGGAAQITELRAGHFNGQVFSDHPGGSLINDRAIAAEIQERVFADQELRGFRAATTLLGLGFVECISSDTLTDIRNNQPVGMKGDANAVAVLEVPGATRIGRFGWKAQHASLLSFAADAYVNEMGITSPLAPVENTSNGRSVVAFDKVADPEDTGGEENFGDNIEAFARFMRSLSPPPRDFALATTPESRSGSATFDAIGCAICHVRVLKTLPAGTAINAGQFHVPQALADKEISPFSDFLLHDVGTGDGVASPGPQTARHKFRTPPLWGLRVKSRLMHDLRTLTRNEAILRHAGEALAVVNRYRGLSRQEQTNLLTFLRSL